MGHSPINYAKKILAKTRMAKLVKEITRLHANVPMAEWQRKRIAEIRALCEEKEKKIFDAANVKCQEVREEYMQFEIDFINGSAAFRETNPGEEMKIEKGFFASLIPSFLKINKHAPKETTNQG